MGCFSQEKILILSTDAYIVPSILQFIDCNKIVQSIQIKIGYEVIQCLITRPIQTVVIHVKAAAASLIQNVVLAIRAIVKPMMVLFQTLPINVNCRIHVERRMLCRVCGEQIFKNSCVSKMYRNMVISGIFPAHRPLHIERLTQTVE